MSAVMDAYAVDGPATISFSGGRTSGFMLRQIIDAHGGVLPADVLVVFCNTGLEHPKTYEFVEAVEREWGVPVHWLEYRDADDAHAFAEVSPGSSSRNGEPFEALIRKSNYVPNPVTRKCTSELKIRTTKRYVRALGWDDWTNVVGLRADEPRRVARMKGDVRSEHVLMPMAEAGATLADVLAFWKAQPFDLELPGGDNSYGNCVGCFLKSKHKLVGIMRNEPEHFGWWTRMEALALASKPSGARFRSDRPTYAQLLEIARTQGYMFDAEEEDTIPCACTN